jgi:hypothetical protein
LHGGIGMTDELGIGHYYKRLMVLAKLYGDESYYLQKFADLAATEAAWGLAYWAGRLSFNRGYGGRWPSLRPLQKSLPDGRTGSRAND